MHVNSFNNRLFTIISHNREKKGLRRHTLRHSLTSQMRLAALKAGGSEALPQSRLPGNCCYATAESPPIKAQRAARRGWAAPRRSKHLWGATLSNHKADKKAGKNVHDHASAFVQLRFTPRMMHHAHHIQRCYVYFPLHMEASMHLRCGLRPGRLLMLQGSQGSPDAEDEIMGTEWTELYWLTRRHIIRIINQNP